MLSLGQMYLTADGVPADYQRAHFWLELARRNGADPSVMNLAGFSVHLSDAEIAESNRRVDAWMQEHR
jgi:TPR repeat protein